MRGAVDEVLAERRERGARRSRWPGVASLLLHATVLLVLIAVPARTARTRQVPEHVAVRIIPLQALGREDAPPRPAPAAPAPVREEPRTRHEEEPREKPALAPPPTRPSEPPSPPERPPATAVGEAGGSPPAAQGSPSGSPLATAAFGAAVAGLDNPDFVYGYYLDQMLALIGANWVRPPLGGVVEAMVAFRVHRDGSVTDIRIVHSSGYNSFDLAGLRAVRAAAPLPPLPRSYSHESLGVNLIVR